MNCTDAGAGQHGIGRLRNHRHVDGDAVTFLDAMFFHDVRQAANLVVELVIRDLLVDVRIIAFPDDGGPLTMSFQVTVDAVVGNIGQAVFKPLDGDLTLEGGILDLCVGLEPVNALAMLAPELVRVFNAFLVPFQVLVLVDQRARLHCLLHRIDFFRHAFLLMLPTLHVQRADVPLVRILIICSDGGN